MSHDFAKGKASKKKPAKRAAPKKNTRSAAKPAAKPHLPGWLWFVSGAIVTVFSQFLFHLTQVDTSKLDQGIVNEAKKQAPVTAEKKAVKKRPKIEFYNTLKNREVKVSGDVVKAREEEEYNYALQAGAFKRRQDAEQQRAEIILMGLDATIESRKNKSGTLFHRIIVGPFTSRSTLSSARSKLIAHNKPSMRIKR
ncbi:MAG: SPOR domain-containing protein [Pseudomonadales bacterium]|nr:SPOR domain-containing protein [Pseudomonadales bacterium]